MNRLFFLKIASLIFLITLVLFMFGCHRKRNVITFPACIEGIRLVGFPHQPPTFVSTTPSFHCFLKGPDFETRQIDFLLVFKKLDSNFVFIYENENNEYFLIDDLQQKGKIQLTSIHDLKLLSYKAQLQGSFELYVIDKKIIVNNIECIAFLWDTGGIQIYGFKDLSAGYAGLFDWDYLKHADPKKTLFIHFIPWNNKTKKHWPLIDSISYGN